jgi:hypothetical protein
MITMSHVSRLSVFAVACVLQVNAVRADDDITLQRAKNFSLYASRNCKRVDVPQVDLMLDCQFQGKRASFYLKEFPKASMPSTNLGEIDINAECERLLRLMLKGVGEDIGERIRLFGGRGTFGPTIYNYYGFSYPSVEDGKNHPLDAAEKRVLFRAHSDVVFGTGMLVVVSDFDRANIRHNFGVPDEAITIFASLDLVQRRLLLP